MENSYVVKGTFFNTALAQWGKRDLLPKKGSFVYEVITKDLGCWITPWRHKAAAYLTVLCGLCFVVGVLLVALGPRRISEYNELPIGMLLFVPMVIMFCVTWPLVMNSTDPVKFILETSEALGLTPEEFCAFPEISLKNRARQVLYSLATEHAYRQGQFPCYAPEFQETYQKYARMHAQFQYARLIPLDIGWGPYFKRDAPIKLSSN